jgi:hypothetical protein
MKSYFAINHNPDAKDLKQLSQKTGLPKRVLQVMQEFTHFSLKNKVRSVLVCGAMFIFHFCALHKFYKMHTAYL